MKLYKADLHVHTTLRRGSTQAKGFFRTKTGHVKRSPLGDPAGTLSSVVCTNPGPEVLCRFRVNRRKVEVARPMVGQERGLRIENNIALSVAWYEEV